MGSSVEVYLDAANCPGPYARNKALEASVEAVAAAAAEAAAPFHE